MADATRGTPYIRNAAGQDDAAEAIRLLRLVNERLVQSLLKAQELDEQHQRLVTRVLALVDDAVTVADAQFRISVWNGGAESLYGWLAAEVLGRGQGEVMQFASGATVAGLSGGAACAVEAEQTRKDGQAVGVQGTTQCLHDGEGRVAGYLTVTRPAAAPSTEQPVPVDDVQQLKQDFLATVSHELRTPLNAILGFTHLVRHSAQVPGVEREQLAIVLASAQHLQRLVDTILMVADLNAGTTRMSLQPFDLVLLVKQVVAEMPLPPPVPVRVVAPDQPAFVQSDAVWARRVVQALLDNAVKFTHEGHIDIGFQAGPERVEFSVTDTGIGIPADRQADIFEAFRQVDGSLSRRYEGLGLGLCLCRTILNRLDGSIRLTSQPGQGSCFTVALPAAAGAASERT